MDGTESISDACGGTDGTESISNACGGTDGTESVNAKAELATTQPAIKAIKLIFIMISSILLLISSSTLAAGHGMPLVVRATPGQNFPHVGATLYA